MRAPMKRKRIFWNAALLLLGLITAACGVEAGKPEPFAVTAAVSSLPDTLDPAAASEEDSETILYHLYENLLAWGDDGEGQAVLIPGQAESYTLKTDYAGNATYTFTLRKGLVWSDGTPVTAGQFVEAWRRLADPGNALPHRELLRWIAGYDQTPPTESDDLSGSGEAMNDPESGSEGNSGNSPESGSAAEGGAWNPEKLAVSAPDSRTLVVALNGNNPAFLETVCAGAYTMPVRTDRITGGVWDEGMVTNGAYTVAGRDGEWLSVRRSETYYNADPLSPEEITFRTTGMAAAEPADVTAPLPAEALTVPEGEKPLWRRMDEPEVLTVMCNTRWEPLNDGSVRQALALAADTQGVTAALGNPAAAAATGVVPYGVSDFGPAEQRKDGSTAYRDFRAHSHELVTVPENGDYASDVEKARQLLAGAGYPGGAGFPALTLLYEEPFSAAAESLRDAWENQLGISIMLAAVNGEDYATAIAAASLEENEPPEKEGTAGTGEMAGDEGHTAIAAPFQLALRMIKAPREDALCFLTPWWGADTYTGYTSEPFDILIAAAETASSAEARDAYLHDAEAILLQDAPVIPLCYGGSGFQMNGTLTGLYSRPGGVFFLGSLRQGNAAH